MAQGVSTTKWFAVVVVLLGAAVAAYVWVEQEQSKPAALHHSMTGAEEAYRSEVEVSNPRMSTASNFLGSNLYYLDAQLSNKGTKTVRRVDLSLAFTDPFGDVVFRQTKDPVTPQTPPLKPGETEPLHIIFEHLPAEWNQGPPSIVVSYVSF
jgi:hypothetical protein